MATTPLSPSTAAAAAAAATSAAGRHLPSAKPPPYSLPVTVTRPRTSSNRPVTKLHVSSSSSETAAAAAATAAAAQPKEETVFFDGGAHYGDLAVNLLLGFTLLWLPLTLAAVSRAFYLRYRFTNLRVTVVSGLTGQDRSDFSYKVIEDVQVVPRFIGEWGDIVITLKDGTKVDLRSVPKFREIAKYCLAMAEKAVVLKGRALRAFEV